MGEKNAGQINSYAGLIWDLAKILRGTYKEGEYGKIILPFTVLRRLDCVLEPTKDKVLAQYDKLKTTKVQNIDIALNRAAGQLFHNHSKYTFAKLRDDPEGLKKNFQKYLDGFSKDAQDILENFEIEKQIDKLDKANLLYEVIKQFAAVDLHPSKVSNLEMGYIFEELIRKFSEASNETAGEHFTPREVIRLMVNLLFLEDKEMLRKKGIIKTLYDPACGTGGMLSVAEEYLLELNPESKLEVFGQELNPESYATCKADMLIKGHSADNIKFGSSFSQDQLPSEKFDYMLSNPPFGVEWKKEQVFIESEHEDKGNSGRFGVGLPRINDGALLFLQHEISKMRPDGTRIAIVFNGSPLFTGGAESGESEIRRWIIENDWLEAIVALPDQLFYNTGIFTYIWIVTNRKPKSRKGKIQLINATSMYKKMRKSLGNKRNEIGETDIEEITKVYGSFKQNGFSKVFDNEEFGYTHVTVERPLQRSFIINSEHIESFKTSTAYSKLDEMEKKALLNLLEKHKGTKTWKNQEAFEEHISGLLEQAKITKSITLAKNLLSSFGEYDPTAEIVRGRDGKPMPDPELRDYENIPFKENIDAYFKREVLPHAPAAWMDRSKDKKGFEINFTRYFYEYKPLRPLGDIRKEILRLERETEGMLKEVVR